ncbi:hypothetical protein H5P28_13110 [Ruficoccus amylovorans]|uniref:Uncharacterized protein n=1 Tax=Ruficoccus amylovorans TaxID=1804625 RepID=A0A842HG81_9BACT|nr:hypothetical protein [Ruficoccus amylovorans]MBC2595200.1 hypothetical protein [Ruficoccus amylovorans]
MAIALLAQYAGAQTTYLNDTFSDNNWQNQNLPSSAEWFQSFNNLSTVEVSTGNYALQNAPTSATVRQGVAYFTSSTAPATLNSTGEILNVSFDLTPTSGTPQSNINGLRFMLADSGSARITEQNSNPNLTLNGAYGFFINPTVQRVRVYNRTSESGSLLTSLGDQWGNALGDDTPADTFAMSQGTTYQVSIQFERLSNGDVSITYTTSDGNSSVSSTIVDSVYKNYSFDTFAFAWNNGFGDGTIDNVMISTAIPEVSGSSLILGSIALGLLALSRRSKR